MKKNQIQRVLMTATVAVISGLGLVCSLFAQQSYQVDATTVQTDVRRGHLDLGGRNTSGDFIDVTSYYIERNGKPFFPIVGEFHYSRFPNAWWDEEIKKMKAGGITIVATYVFWNLHEPRENTFCWEGDLNLHRFIKLCQANELECIVRIGPFAHGEMRNGGLPDWLYGRPFEVRSNDSAYLYYANRFYTQIAGQLSGLYFKDGGPVIGIQIENEYQHSAAPWAITYNDAPREVTAARHDRKIIQAGVGVNLDGNEFAEYGQSHMEILKNMAKRAGMDVPLYTATGWGRASIINNSSVPVMAGYAYPFWVADNSPSAFYLFKDLHHTPDYSPVSYVPEDYPYLAAELGTGMCVTYSRRPRVPGESFFPLMVRTVGSGCNGLGYYMYHGGTTPSDHFFMYSEGFGLNLKSYDYQAPIGEFGNPGTGFFGLKLINMFLQHYGSELAPLFPVIPETNTRIVPTDTSVLRYSVRTDGLKGFLFLNNFQDHIKTADLQNLKIRIKTHEGMVSFPQQETFTLNSGVSAVFPFNMDYSGIRILHATVQPLCTFMNAGITHHIFTTIHGISPEIVVKGRQQVRAKGAKTANLSGNTLITGNTDQMFRFEIGSVRFLIIPFEKALHAYLVGNTGEQNLVITDALVLDDRQELELISTGKDTWNIEIYPQVKNLHSSDAEIRTGKTINSFCSSFDLNVPKADPGVSVSQYDDRHFILDARELNLSTLNDVYVKFDYRGDRGLCMLNGELATDNLYTSKPWLIGLKRYQQILKNTDMYFYFLPMAKDAPYLNYLDPHVIPDFSEHNEFLEINEPEIIPEYKIHVRIVH